MTTKFNPPNPNIKGFIHDNRNIIEHSTDCAPTFPDKPIISFKSLPNIRDLLTKTSFEYPPKAIEIKSLIPSQCTRFGKFTYCPLIKKLDDVTCKVSGDKHKTKDLLKLISYE